MIKKLTFLLLAFSFLSLNAAESNKKTAKNKCAIIEKTEQKATKFLSSKKFQKNVQNLKNAVIEKKDDLIIQISESQLSDQQKNGIIEALDAVDNLN